MTATDGGKPGAAVLLLGVLVAVAVGTLALSGTVTSQSSVGVDVEDTIRPDQESFDVTIGATDGARTCVIVRKNGDAKDEASFLTEGEETVPVSRSSVDGYEHGDDLTAELRPMGGSGAAAPSTCDFVAASDTTTVTATGSVDLDDRISAEDPSFDVTVTELHTASGRGCVVVRTADSATPTLRTYDDVEQGEAVRVTREDVGGFRAGDEISVELRRDGCPGPALDAETTTVAGTGAVDLEDEILADQTSFEATIAALETASGDGCLVAENADNDDTGADFGDRRAGDSVTVTEDHVGRWTGGDEIVVRLFDGTCEGVELDRETTVVEARGRVELEERISADQTAVRVSVTGLRIDDSSGCVVVDNSEGGQARATGFASGETRTIPEDDLGGLARGDEIVARLVADRTCDGSVLDRDTRIVAPAQTATPTPTATATPTATVTSTDATTATAEPTPTEQTTRRDGEADGGTTPRFEVEIDEARPPDDEDDPLEVEATIENTGEERDTQTVRLSVDGEERDVSQLTLDGGESRTVRFSWDDPTDAEQHDVEVASHDDADDTLAQLGQQSEQGGLSGSTGGLLLLLLLLALLAYYYVRRRRSGGDQTYVDEDGE